MTILCDIIFIILFILYFPVLLLKGKWHPGFKMRFGNIPPAVRQQLIGKTNIWFHAVSVGEVLAVIGLIKKVKALFPKYRVVVSTVTPTGHDLAKSQLTKDDIVIYAPLDISLIVHRYIQAIQPKLYISAETELWPNLFTALASARVPIVQVNGRISEQSFHNYQKVKPLLKNALAGVAVFCMQSPTDGERIKQLGVDPAKVQITGNMKFDDAGAPAVSSLPLRYPSSDMVWIAGSTHPGEEKIILGIFQSLRQEFPALRLVIAPRHVERAPEVTQLVEAQSFKPLLFSQVSAAAAPGDAVIVVDTIGHLRALYQLATVVFVGKSLAGQGGQNIIEPAFFGKPIVVGPNMQNFRNIFSLFQEAEAIVQVKDSAELLPAMQRLLRDPHLMRKIGEAAKDVIGRNQGATEKTCRVISGFLSVSK